MKRKSFLWVLVCLLGMLPASSLFAQEPDTLTLDGLWQTQGYGMVIAAAEGQAAVYQVTAISCLLLLETPYEGDSLPELQMTVSALDDDHLVLRDLMTAYMILDPIDQLPAPCADGGTANTDDPELNFEVFWHTFNEQYAFFYLYDVDWQAQYDTFRPRVTADTTPEELFSILSEMITPLKDGHVSLISDVGEFSPGTLPEWLEGDSATIIGDFIQKQYLSGDEVTLVGNHLIAYRKLDDRTGYIFIQAMYGYALDNANEVEAAAQAIDEALAALDGVERMIVDVRFNGGGLDAVALVLASRFADDKHLAFSKQARNGDSFTPLREYFVEPGGERQFTGPVVLLTSGLTASAAEIFVMAMRELPHVTVMGEATSGGHSDILGCMLPNGWSFGLSNEVYRAADGQIYEKAGLPPDQAIPFDAEGFVAGSDNVLNAAWLIAP
ncbi:MAG: S41 family peptidase [Chloroflexi bacterium]|nr:S41 family peptidase [Chloroflexota bacterium]